MCVARANLSLGWEEMIRFLAGGYFDLLPFVSKISPLAWLWKANELKRLANL